MLRRKLYEFFQTHQVLNFTSLAQFLTDNGVFDNEQEGIVAGAIKVDTEVAADYLYGKTLNALQTGITITDTAISGTLHYVDDYSSAFGSDYDEGYYLALRFEAPGADKIEVRVEHGDFDFVELVADDNYTCVFKISDTDTQGITVKVVKGNEFFGKYFILTDLVLEEVETTG